MKTARDWAEQAYSGMTMPQIMAVQAAIDAAVARERARCAAWVGTPSLSISEIIAAIERGDEP